MPGQLLVAEQLHANVHDAVGHRVRLVAFHQGFHDEGVMLNKRLSEGDLMRKKKVTVTACCSHTAPFSVARSNNSKGILGYDEKTKAKKMKH